MRVGIRPLAALLVAGLLAATAGFEPSRADDGGLYKVGDLVGTHKAVDLATGKEVTLADLKGKVVFVNFFALK